MFLKNGNNITQRYYYSPIVLNLKTDIILAKQETDVLRINTFHRAVEVYFPFILNKQITMKDKKEHHSKRKNPGLKV